MVSCDCQCSVAFRHGAVGCFVVFSDQSNLLLGLKARLSALHEALPDVNVKV